MVEMQRRLRQAFHHMHCLKKALIILAAALLLHSNLSGATLKSSRKKSPASSNLTVSLKVNPSRNPMPPSSLSAEAVEQPMLKASPAFVEMDLPTDNQMLFSKTD